MFCFFSGALQSFGCNLEDYVSLLVPPICVQFENPSRKDHNDVRIAALRTIEVFCDDLELKDHSTRIVHAIARTIDNNPHDKVSFEKKKFVFYFS